MAGLGAPELLIVLVIILLVFGGAKLPKLARSLGQAQREFRAGTKDEVEAPEPKEPAETKEPKALEAARQQQSQAAPQQQQPAPSRDA